MMLGDSIAVQKHAWRKFHQGNMGFVVSDKLSIIALQEVGTWKSVLQPKRFTGFQLMLGTASDCGFLVPNAFYLWFDTTILELAGP